MSDPRDLGAGAYDEKHGFVMSGGVQTLNSVDRTLDGSAIASLAPLPSGVQAHCLVSLDNGGDIFMAGPESYS